METIHTEEVKIDKRTKAYKESLQQPSPLEDVDSFTTDGVVPTGQDMPNPEMQQVPGEVKTVLPEDNPGEAVVYEPARKPDFSKAKDNPGFTLCCECGKDTLEPNDDGSPKFRRFGVPCESCVNKNKTKAIINGKEFEIDPTDLPKPHYYKDRSGAERKEYKDSTGKVYK